VKQLTRGSKLYVPVAVDGALYSVGDGHYAQGDSECCGTAIEMGATAVVRFRIHRGKKIAWPRFSHAKYDNRLERNFIATMGMPVTPDGRQENCDLNLAARNAVLEMIKLLEERGWTREQAYVLCSVAVDLRVSNVVDVPNVTVSALLPEDIFL
jgi:formamidase